MKHNIAWLQAIVQSNSNKNGIVPEQNKYMNQWNSVEDTETFPDKLSYLIFK